MKGVDYPAMTTISIKAAKKEGVANATTNGVYANGFSDVGLQVSGDRNHPELRHSTSLNLLDPSGEKNVQVQPLISAVEGSNCGLNVDVQRVSQIHRIFTNALTHAAQHTHRNQ